MKVYDRDGQLVLIVQGQYGQELLDSGIAELAELVRERRRARREECENGVLTDEVTVEIVGWDACGSASRDTVATLGWMTRFVRTTRMTYRMHFDFPPQIAHVGSAVLMDALEDDDDRIVAVVHAAEVQA